MPKISPPSCLIPEINHQRHDQNPHQERWAILIMIPRRLPIPDTPASVDIDDEGVGERENSDERESACGEKGSARWFGTEVDYQGGHGADVD